MRGKSLLIKVGIVVVVLLIFIGFLQFKDYQNKHFSVDKKKFNVKNSLAAVMASDYKSIPKLENADHYDIVENVNKDVSLVNMRRDLRIEKVWLLPYQIYIITSFKLGKNDQSLDDIPELKINKLIFHRDNGRDIPYSIMKEYGDKSQENSDPKLERRTYNHRVYQSQVIPISFDVTYNGQDESQDDLLNHINKVTLNDIKLVTKQKNKKRKKETSIKDITFPVSFNFDKYLIKTIPLDQTMAFNGTKIVFTSYQLYYDHGSINYNVKTPAEIVNISSASTFDGKEVEGPKDQNSKNLVYGGFDIMGMDKGQIYIQNPDFKTITIKPQEYTYKDKKKVNFTITKKQINQLTNGDTHEIQIGKINTHKIYFGVRENNMIEGNFYLKFDNGEEDYPQLDLNLTSFISRDEFNLMVKDAPDEDLSYIKATRTLISVTNEKNKTLHTLESQGGGDDSSGKTMTYNFVINPTEWNISNEFHFTIEGFPYRDKVEVDPVTIRLKE